MVTGCRRRLLGLSDEGLAGEGGLCHPAVCGRDPEFPFAETLGRDLRFILQAMIFYRGGNDLPIGVFEIGAKRNIVKAVKTV